MAKEMWNRFLRPAAIGFVVFVAVSLCLLAFVNGPTHLELLVLSLIQGVLAAYMIYMAEKWREWRSQPFVARPGPPWKHVRLLAGFLVMTLTAGVTVIEVGESGLLEAFLFALFLGVMAAVLVILTFKRDEGGWMSRGWRW
jgi:hypothetical protein